MRIRIVWTLVLSLAMGVAAQAAPVRGAVTIGVSPSIVELSGNPGSSGPVDLTVLNRGDESFDVTIKAIDYDRVDPSLSVPSWLTLAQNTAHLDIGGQAIIPITMAIPEDASPGGHYAAISITTGSGDAEGGSTAISGQLIVPYLITVEGKQTRKAEIERFNAFLELDGRLGFRTDVTNDGNIHWKPVGKAIVTKGDGSDYGNLDLEQYTIFPLGSGILTTSSTLPVGAGGAYKATAEIDYGSKKPVRAETTFTFASQLSVTGNACENLDRGPTMTANMINAGDLGVVSVVNMTITTGDGQPVGQTGIIGPNLVWPGETAIVGTDLPQRLQTGDYMLSIATQTGASPDPIITDVPFSIGGTGPNVAPICEQPASTPAAD